MTAALKGVSGVDTVQVTLATKLATVTFKPQNTVQIEDLRKAILPTGFKPADAVIEVRCGLSQFQGATALQVTFSNQVYRLADGKDAEGKELKGIVQRLATDAVGQKDKLLVVTGLHEDAPPPAKEGEKPLPPVLRVTAYRFEAPPPAR